MKYKRYVKKLTPQELGYRNGRLRTGQYFYISKFAVGTFFERLDKYILNDKRLLTFNDLLRDGEVIKATYVFHNDKYALENGTRDEYRIYLNRNLAKHELHFQPNDIIVFEMLDDSSINLLHYNESSKNYTDLLKEIENSKTRGNHALS